MGTSHHHPSSCGAPCGATSATTGAASAAAPPAPVAPRAYARFDMDRLGAAASFACAVHCAAIPILVGLGAAGAVSWLEHEPVEWGLVGLAAVVGTVSAWRGYRVHGNKTVAIVLAAAALSLLVLMLHEAGIGPYGHGHGHSHAHDGDLRWVFPVIGVVIAASHLVNRRLCRSCTSCASGAPDAAGADPSGDAAR